MIDSLKNSETAVMTVSDFRKITGSATADYSDTQIKEIIQQLAFLAEIYFNTTNN
jgi:hypothetical protein